MAKKSDKVRKPKQDRLTFNFGANVPKPKNRRGKKGQPIGGGS